MRSNIPILDTFCFPAVGIETDMRIDIYDTGIGMSADELPQIFEAFQRLDSSRSDGLGLGLFIVRRAVELLGHRIEVSSTVGRGSRFSVLAKTQL